MFSDERGEKSNAGTGDDTGSKTKLWTHVDLLSCNKEVVDGEGILIQGKGLFAKL